MALLSLFSGRKNSQVGLVARVLLSYSLEAYCAAEDYAKDGELRVVRLLCSFCHEPLGSLIVITLRFEGKFVSD